MTDNEKVDWVSELEENALALITVELGWEPKSARGFIAGFLWRSAEPNAKVPTQMEIADAYHEWFYNLSSGTLKYYRDDNPLDLTRKEN